MADIKSIQVDGIDYAIKDESARSNIGDLSKLATEAKGDLVSALNELSANAGSGSSPIQRVESLDESNLKNLRDLATGSYVLYGYFRPYAGASNYLPFDNLLVNVYHVDEGSHLFEFSTANSEVNFIEILVDATAEGGHTYSRTAISMLELNGLIGKMGNLNELATTEKGSVVAAINEVAQSGGSTVAIDATLTQSGQAADAKAVGDALKSNGVISGFSGKTASFYGDSLTEENYHYTKGYHSWVKELLDLASYNNYGVSGYKISDVYNKVNEISDTSDIIFVMCGVNDQSFSVPLGSLGDNTAETTYGSLNLLCALLKSKYPISTIVFITPHYQTCYVHDSGVTSYEVAKAIKEVCEKYAIPVFDNFVVSGFYSTNISYWTTDNCHWNDKAHEMVGRNLAGYVLNTFNKSSKLKSDVSSITASFNQGDAVIYSGDTLNSLRPYLTVTANYEDGSSETVEEYTLRGAVVAGTNSITASYFGKTVDFDVEAAYKAVTGASATIKSAEVFGCTHVGFLVENPNIGSSAQVKLEAYCDSLVTLNHVDQRVNAPWTYSSIEDFNAATYVDFNGSTLANVVTDGDGSIEIEGSHTSASPYYAVFVPFRVEDTPYSVTLRDVALYINGAKMDILAVNTFKDNNFSKYAEITPTRNAVPEKTMEITGNKFDQWNLSLYVAKEDLPAISGVTTKWGVTIRPLTEGDAITVEAGGGVYTVDIESALLAGYTAVENCNSREVVTHSDEVYSFEAEPQNPISHTIDRNYWCFAINLALPVGSKFIVSDYYVRIDGVNQNIHSIGGAFVEETFIIS